MHDRTVDRTTDGSGPIAELDWAALRRLDAGDGEPVPELAEVWAAFPSVGLQIEVKDRAATTAVLDLISAGPARDAPTTITSFHPEVLREASQRTGPWQVGLIFGRLDEARLAEGLDLEVDQVLIHWALSGTSAARDQRARVRAANVWISRTPQDIWRAMADGWTETTVDDPAMALAARAGHESALGRP